MSSYANIAVILHFVTPEPLSEEQATSAVRCFLQQQGRCEPLPLSWYIGVPVEAEESAPWVQEWQRKNPPPSPSLDSPLFSPLANLSRRDQGWLD